MSASGTRITRNPPFPCLTSSTPMYKNLLLAVMLGKSRQPAVLEQGAAIPRSLEVKSHDCQSWLVPAVNSASSMSGRMAANLNLLLPHGAIGGIDGIEQPVLFGRNSISQMNLSMLGTYSRD